MGRGRLEWHAIAEQAIIGRARALPYRVRVGLVLAPGVIALAALPAVPPIGQDPAYHDFADQRGWLGLAHAGNLLSNLGFLLVGGLGLGVLASARAGPAFATGAERAPYLVYFLGVLLVAFGSAYYHADPTTQSLFWDRLTMSVAFMGLFSAVIMERIHVTAGVRLLPVLVALGVASVVFWQLGERAGQGDLRFYAVAQFYPFIAIPLICLLFPGRGGRALIALFSLYGLALVCEHLDHEIYLALGGAMSGHSLKHLIAAMAAAMVLPLIWRRIIHL